MLNLWYISCSPAVKIPDYKIVLLGFIIFLLRRYVVMPDPYVSKTGSLNAAAQIVMAT